MWKHFVIVIAVSIQVVSAIVAQAAADEALTSVLLHQTGTAGVEREATTITITLDFARVLTFNRSARTIIIGNPGIIDGTLSDDRTIVLTGKAFGTTNVIILGEGGEEIANLAVNVAGNQAKMTTVYQGSEQHVFSCAGPCRPVVASDIKK
jgi:Flp pilus assembly secretin CpaC